MLILKAGDAMLMKSCMIIPTLALLNSVIRGPHESKLLHHQITLQFFFQSYPQFHVLKRVFARHLILSGAAQKLACPNGVFLNRDNPELGHAVIQCHEFYLSLDHQFRDPLINQLLL